MREHGAPSRCREMVVVSIEQVATFDWRHEGAAATTIPAGMPGGRGTWYGRWTIDRCGDVRAYVVAFAPDPRGGTNIAARLATVPAGV